MPSSPKLLLLDSDDQRRASIAEPLVQNGLAVIEAESALAGVEEIRSESPSVVICSDSLSGVSTADFLTQVRTDYAAGSIPILVYGRSARRRLEAEKAGADDYLIVPDDLPKLPHRVRLLIKHEGSQFFQGELGIVTLADVVQMLMAARCDGELVVAVDATTGRMFFRQGQLFFCEFEAGQGEDALLSLFRASRNGGDFHFSPQIDGPIPPANIKGRTDHLLLSIANRMDEGGQGP